MTQHQDFIPSPKHGRLSRAIHAKVAGDAAVDKNDEEAAVAATTSARTLRLFLDGVSLWMSLQPASEIVVHVDSATFGRVLRWTFGRRQASATCSKSSGFSMLNRQSTIGIGALATQ